MSNADDYAFAVQPSSKSPNATSRWSPHCRLPPCTSIPLATPWVAPLLFAVTNPWVVSLIFGVTNALFKVTTRGLTHQLPGDVGGLLVEFTEPELEYNMETSEPGLFSFHDLRSVSAVSNPGGGSLASADC